jgi:hypothetical protein
LDFREGDYIKTKDDLFFTVKGLKHPSEYVIAYLRYIPDKAGDREINGVRYKRVYNLNSTTNYLNKNYPEYLNKVNSKHLLLQAVPIDKIKRIYLPHKKLNNIYASPESPLEKTIKKMTHILLTKSGIPLDHMGVSGSILIGLDNNESDIDLIIYGEKEGRSVYTCLEKIREEENWINAYTLTDATRIAHERWGSLISKYKKLISIEKKKVLHGRVEERDYFIRLIPKIDRLKEKKSKPLKKTRVKGVISDDMYSIFTPCIYYLNDGRTSNINEIDVSYLLSYRGRFTEQGVNCDEVMAYGTLEKVIRNKNETEYRLIMGDKEDYLLPINEKNV